MFEQPTGTCAGLKVVELGTSMVSGPFCGQMLGDLGAEVIKIEGPAGDLMRSVPPFHQEMSGQFLQFNRNKRSIMLDLKSPADRDTALEIVRTADVLIENFRPGVTERLGLDYGLARRINARLIYVSINGFGSDGPYASLPAYDQVIQGVAGFMPLQGSVEDPAAIRSVIVDKITALSATTATLAALLHRERGGGGQHVEVRMLDAFAAMMLPEFMAAHTFADQPAGHYPSTAIYRTLRTSDGHVVGLIAQDRQFAAICRALGCDELVDDPRYATAAARFAAMGDILGILESKTTTMTTKELLELLWKDSDVAIGPVHTLASFLDDPQVRHNGTVFEQADAALGSLRNIGPFASFGATPIRTFRRAPRLGEHGDEIRAEIGR